MKYWIESFIAKIETNADFISICEKVKKSCLIIIQFVIISAVSCLGFSAIAETYKETGIIENGLSDKAYKINFEQTDETFIDVSKFMKLIKDEGIVCFAIYKESTSLFLEFYKSEIPNSIFQDVNNVALNSNLIIIDSSLKNNIEEVNGINYCEINGKKFEVIKILEDDKGRKRTASKCFVSMTGNEALSGTFFLDGVSQEILDKVLVEVNHIATNINVKYSPVKQTFKERVNSLIKLQYYIIFSLLLTFLLMMVSFLGAVMNWLAAKSKELKIHVLVGAKYMQLYRMLFQEFTQIAILSFSFGVAISFLIYKIGIFQLIIRNINFLGVSVAFASCYFVGSLLLSIALMRAIKMNLKL